jgi:hypothetical protein
MLSLSALDVPRHYFRRPAPPRRAMADPTAYRLDGSGTDALGPVVESLCTLLELPPPDRPPPHAKAWTSAAPTSNALTMNAAVTIPFIRSSVAALNPEIRDAIRWPLNDCRFFRSEASIGGRA